MSLWVIITLVTVALLFDFMNGFFKLLIRNIVFL